MKLIDFKCPNCNASVAFDNNAESTECEYCGTMLYFQEEMDKVQNINAAGIQEYTDRLYDLIRQEKFVQVTKDVEEALKQYPYAGRLHLCLLLAELGLKKPSLLASVGRDYTSSINYQNCIRYMTTEDKEDLLSLVEKNKSAVPQAKQPIKVDTKGYSATNEAINDFVGNAIGMHKASLVRKNSEENIISSQSANRQATHNVSNSEQISKNITETTDDVAPQKVANEVNTIDESNAKIKKKKGGKAKSLIIVIIPLSLFVILFIVGIILAVTGNVFGKYLLIASGVLELLIAVVLYFVIDRIILFKCPECGATRVHTREFIRQEWVKKDPRWSDSQTIQVNTYMDYYTCPECGETFSRQVQKKNENGIHEF